MLDRSAVAPESVRAALDRALASKALRGANRSSVLLRYLVEQTLAGRAAYLKEYTLGVEALGRGSDFDPRGDPIARVEASRLRSRLELYYATEGAGDEIVISLPKGAYVPQFEARARLPAEAAPSRSSFGRPWPARTGAVAALAIAAVAFVAGRTSVVGDRTDAGSQAVQLRVDMSLGAPGVLGSEVGNDLALSPDGEVLVFVALLDDGSTRLYARRLDALEARELPGTVGARGPFFSPDGRWVGFWAQGSIKKTLVDGGGSPTTLTDATDLLGASWNEAGDIVASLSRIPALWRLPDAGGMPTPLLELGSDGPHPRWPQWLPGNRHVLYTAIAGPADSSIVIASLDGGTQTTVARGTYGRYLANGTLVYVDRGTLFAMPLDLERVRAVGPPAPVLSEVGYSPTFGFAHFDARNGRLVYRRGGGELTTLAWLDTAGRATPLPISPGRFQWLRVSPDGRQVAFSLLEDSDFDIWRYDLVAHTKTRLTGAGHDEGSPVWTPDGTAMLYSSGRGAMYWQPVDGPQRAVPALPGVSIPWSFTPDGRRLAYHALDPETGFDLWTVPVERAADGLHIGAPEPYFASEVYESYPSFSPDGHWIAYGSNESGIWQIYVRAFPDHGRRVRVSTNGGRVPAWSRSAPELVYETLDHRLMAASYRIVDSAFVAEAPREWSPAQLADSGVVASFDLAPDGERALVLLPPEGRAGRDHVTLLLDFDAEARRALRR